MVLVRDIVQATAKVVVKEIAREVAEPVAECLAKPPVKAIANNIAVEAAAKHVKADVGTVVRGLLRAMAVATVPLKAVEAVPATAMTVVAVVVPMGVQAVVQVVQVIAREAVLVTALAHAILDVGVCVEALVKEPVRADVITPVGMHVIDHVGQILPLLEDTLFFK